MTDIERDLIETLCNLRANAYAPYSDHPVAAVVETASGRRFGGANIEAAHFKSLCAEASAIAAMASAGEREIRTVYILGPGRSPCPPCGDCRQRIREFSHSDARVVLISENGDVLGTHTIGELLPDSFGPDNVKR